MKDGTIIFWRNSKANPNEFKRYDMKKFEGPVWRISWSVAGDLLAVSSSGHNLEHFVEVFKVREYSLSPNPLKESEQHFWEKISRVDDEAGPQE